jgi:hypothetical protein
MLMVADLRGDRVAVEGEVDSAGCRHCGKTFFDADLRRFTQIKISEMEFAP